MNIKLITNGKTYTLAEELYYYSPRYEKSITCEKGMMSDGATGAIDICPKAWLVHDKLCYTGKWDDNSLCNNWQASSVIHDILKDEGYSFRAHTWRIATYLFGGGEARINGFF